MDWNSVSEILPDTTAPTDKIILAAMWRPEFNDYLFKEAVYKPETGWFDMAGTDPIGEIFPVTYWTYLNQPPPPKLA